MADTSLLDLRKFQIFSILNGPATKILTVILKHGTNNLNPTVTFDQYLTSLTVTSTANYMKLKEKDKKKQFNPSELQQIQNNPSWDNFDVTLLFKAIRLACINIAGLNDTKWKDQNEMEGLITKIKDERNTCVHEKKVMNEADFQAKVDELKVIFDKTLTAAKVRYNMADSDFTPVRDKVFQDISSIKTLTAKEILEKYMKDVLPTFIEESKVHLQGLYQQAQYFDPLSFLSGSQQQVDIQSIFCKAFLIEKEDVAKTVDIDCLDLLTLTRSMTQSPQPSTSSQVTQSTQGGKPHLIMISGHAGSGKTTLLTFIMSEWIKDAHNCRIKHLNEYDIVLRILCREKDGPSIQDFLQQVLPNIFVCIKDSLVTLLKGCKVAFLIDGLDELSPGSSSDQLITDILNTGKNIPEFTIICTSRPESVDDFLAKAPHSYHQWKMQMKGVIPEHRTDFVFKYYRSFLPKKDIEEVFLKNIMEDIGWKDHFQLPLNLLFLAKLFYIDHNSVKKKMTQTSLYLIIHEWCKKKLQDRLATHSQVGRMVREKSIKKVLKVIYHVALQGLLKDRLSLTEEETDQLVECCNKEKLPSTEVLGAFFCLREDVVMLVRRQKYSAPHKSLQEFFAAQHIVENLQEDLSDGSIRHMLQDPSPPQLRKLNNLLLQVAGLLSQPDVPSMLGAIQEVVDLLEETEVKSCNDWLRLLQDTEVNTNVLERVLEHITRNSRGGGRHEIVDITDTTVTSAAALLPLIPHKTVYIELHREPDITELYRVTANHSCTRLSLWHHYKQHIPPPASDSVLRDLLPLSHLQWFVGHLSADGIMLLQGCQRLVYLSLAVTGDHEPQRILSTLAHVCTSLHHLSSLSIHVPVKTVTAQVLTTPLPDLTDDDGYPSVTLVLSGVDEQLFDETCRIVTALQPSVTGYRYIMFPDTKMEAAMWKDLINLLGNAGVRVGQGDGGSLLMGSVCVLDTNIMTVQEKRELNNLTKTKMLCGFDRCSLLCVRGTRYSTLTPTDISSLDYEATVVESRLGITDIDI